MSWGRRWGSTWGVGPRPEERRLHVLDPEAVSISEGPIDPRSETETPATRRKELRAITMGLILVNLLLGATLATTSGSRGDPTTWIRDCCRGDGPAAYCCLGCCWFRSDCKTDLDCRPVRT